MLNPLFDHRTGIFKRWLLVSQYCRPHCLFCDLIFLSVNLLHGYLYHRPELVHLVLRDTHIFNLDLDIVAEQICEELFVASIYY